VGNVTQFVYGQFGGTALGDRLTEVTDARGNVTRFRYDVRGNQTAVTDASNRSESAAYDALGNPTSLTNRRGRAIGYIYNAAGQVTRKTFADGTQQAFTYDVRGNLLTATDADGTTTFAYDAGDRLTRVSYPGGRFLAYTYDAAGRRTRMVDQAGFTVNYAYDAAGRLASLTDGTGARIVSYSYDADGRLSREDKGNGTFTTYEYDAAGQVLHLVNRASNEAVNSRFDYTYDGLGRRTGMATTDGTWAYEYDPIGQLTHAVFTSTNAAIPNQDLRYAYDAVGNRTQTVENGVTTAYVTNNLNQYTRVGAADYAYDADGNLVSVTNGTATSTYTYDDENDLTAVTTPGGTWAYDYDSLGHRVATVQNGQRTDFLLDPTGLGRVVGAYDGAGGLVAHYVYGLGLTSRIAPAGAGYYDFDALGSAAGLTGATGGYLNRYSYAPFGERLASVEAAANPFEFVGRFGVMQEGNGFEFMRSRYYAPAAGRFAAPDPIGLRSGDVNGYRYGFNAPAERVDPSGHVIPLVIGGVALGKVLLDAAIATAIIAAAALAADAIDDAINNTQPIPVPDDLLEPRDPPAVPWDGIPGEEPWDGIPGSPPFGFPWNNLSGVLPLDGTRTLDRTPSRRPDRPPVPPHDGKQRRETDDDQIKLPYDPNAKTGPAGFGAANFVRADGLFPYRIDFENDAAATAPAQRVDVLDQLPTNLDWATLEFTEVGFDDSLIAVPPGLRHFRTTVPMRYNNRDFQVDIELDFNSLTGQILASFRSLDPATGLPPDVLTGFLPPEDGTGRGQGHFGYVVRPRPGLPTGTPIRNVARIRFDFGEIIDTNQVDPHDPTRGTDPTKEALLTLDAGPPTSSVQALPAVTNTASFLVRWSGADDSSGSGVARYDVYVSDNNGPFTIWQTGTPATSAAFDAQNGHAYSFYGVATDNVGNRQPTPAGGQAGTTAHIRPPQVQSVVINGGAAQRSMVTSLTVTFNTTVTLDPGAFSLQRIGGTSVALTPTVFILNGQTVVVLTFTGAGIVGGSLADGKYALAVNAAAAHDHLGNGLDGNGDGTAGDDYTLADSGQAGGLYRLFGDANGDRVVNQADLSLLRTVFGANATDPTFDVNADGVINQADLNLFRANFGAVI
jgi:RHS repeat-associated protein